jgi:hypothetical protein
VATGAEEGRKLIIMDNPLQKKRSGIEGGIIK